MALFATESLSHRPRWYSGPIYVFGAHVETGEIAFGASGSSFGASGRNRALLLGGREVLEY